MYQYGKRCYREKVKTAFTAAGGDMDDVALDVEAPTIVIVGQECKICV